MVINGHSYADLSIKEASEAKENRKYIMLTRKGELGRVSEISLIPIEMKHLKKICLMLNDVIRQDHIQLNFQSKGEFKKNLRSKRNQPQISATNCKLKRGLSFIPSKH